MHRETYTSIIDNRLFCLKLIFIFAEYKNRKCRMPPSSHLFVLIKKNLSFIKLRTHPTIWLQKIVNSK
jgi:hypothetical protein